MKRLIKSVLKLLALATIVLIVMGVVYEQLGGRRDRQRFPQVGHSVAIGSRSLNIYCSGEGNPSVILEGAVGYQWMPVQREVAKFSRVCWYDRAGHGWSDPGPSPRTGAAMANDLHELLLAAGVAPPYVLVGASFGGFPVRIFTGKYPNEVIGVVLVDASHEDQHEPRTMQAPINRLPSLIRTMLCGSLPTAGRVGIVRLFSGSSDQMRDPPPGMNDAEARYFYFLSNLPKSIVASGNESCNWETTASQARNAGKLGDRPLIVLTAGKESVPDDPALAKEAAAFHQRWVNELQPQLAHLSTQGKQIVVEDSGHAMRDDAVIDAVRQIVTQVRATAK